MATNQQTAQTEALESSVAGACQLVAADAEITAIHLVMGRRPTYRELLRCRALTEAHGQTMVVLAAGGVVLRPRRSRGFGEGTVYGHEDRD